jgi:hypothetical protein
MGRPRKTRITKEEIIAYREDKKIPSYKRKKDIKPGPWTNIEVDFKVEANLRFSKHVIEKFGETCGSYTNDSDWYEKGWYPVVFNIVIDGLDELIKKHGVDKVLAACENSLCEAEEADGKRKYGDLIILKLGSDNSQNPDPTKRFISCHGKTNKKFIEGFMANRSGEYKKI